MIGATTGAVKNAYPSGAPEFIHGFVGISCWSVFSFFCVVLICLFLFGHCIVCTSSIYGSWLPLLYLRTVRNMIWQWHRFNYNYFSIQNIYSYIFSALYYVDSFFNLFMNRKLKQWWSTIPAKSTKRIIISHLIPLNLRQNGQQRHMTLKILVMALDGHKYVAGLFIYLYIYFFFFCKMSNLDNSANWEICVIYQGDALSCKVRLINLECNQACPCNNKSFILFLFTCIWLYIFILRFPRNVL